MAITIDGEMERILRAAMAEWHAAEKVFRAALNKGDMFGLNESSKAREAAAQKVALMMSTVVS